MVIRSLKGYGVYEAALKQGRRFTSGPATLTVLLRNEGSGSNHLELGVMVGKRTSPKSVVRSRIRRLLRESIRSAIATNESLVLKSNVATVLLGWRMGSSTPSSIHLSDVQPHVERVLLKAVGAVAIVSGESH